MAYREIHPMQTLAGYVLQIGDYVVKRDKGSKPADARHYRVHALVNDGRDHQYQVIIIKTPSVPAVWGIASSLDLDLVQPMTDPALAAHVDAIREACRELQFDAMNADPQELMTQLAEEYESDMTDRECAEFIASYLDDDRLADLGVLDYRELDVDQCDRLGLDPTCRDRGIPWRFYELTPEQRAILGL